MEVYEFGLARSTTGEGQLSVVVVTMGAMRSYETLCNRDKETLGHNQQA
jgi:hypothetical protein